MCSVISDVVRVMYRNCFGLLIHLFQLILLIYFIADHFFIIFQTVGVGGS